MTTGAVLYTPEILALATGLAAFRWDEALPLQGSARSRSCGSTLALGLALDGEGRIARIGLRAHACAIGQASAAIFAQGAVGCDGARVRATAAAIQAWLDGEGLLPDWPCLSAIAPARDYPGRHGAILLGWQAASEILP